MRRRILTTTWPISPAAPRPSQGLPSRMIPPPTPVPQKTPRIVSNCLPAPSSNSAWTATWTSLPSRTGSRAARESRSASGNGPSSRGGCAASRRCRSPRRRPRASPRRRRRVARSPRRPRPPPRAAPPPSRRGDVLGAALGRRRAPRLAGDLVSASTTTAWILVPPRSIPPRACLRLGRDSRSAR